METKPSPQFKIILGSSSIARWQILYEMGFEFTTMTADIDEKVIRKETPEELVVALAEAKADAIVSKLQTISNQDKDDKPTILIAADTQSLSYLVKTSWAEAMLLRLPLGDYIAETELTLLITADQVVVYEGVVQEKPSGEEEARQFIKGYSGSHAATVGSVVVTNLKTGFRKGEWDRVEIYFHEIPDEVVEKLIEQGAVLNVAGALIIEHPLMRPYIKEVVGTTDSVMGLPKALTVKLIKEAL